MENDNLKILFEQSPGSISSSIYNSHTTVPYIIVPQLPLITAAGRLVLSGMNLNNGHQQHHDLSKTTMTYCTAANPVSVCGWNGIELLSNKLPTYVENYTRLRSIILVASCLTGIQTKGIAEVLAPLGKMIWLQRAKIALSIVHDEVELSYKKRTNLMDKFGKSSSVCMNPIEKTSKISINSIENSCTQSIPWMGSTSVMSRNKIE